MQICASHSLRIELIQHLLRRFLTAESLYICIFIARVLQLGLANVARQLGIAAVKAVTFVSLIVVAGRKVGVCLWSGPTLGA